MGIVSFVRRVYGRRFISFVTLSYLLTTIKSVAGISLIWYLGIMIDVISDGMDVVMQYFYILCVSLVICIATTCVLSFVTGNIDRIFRNILRAKVISSLCFMEFMYIEKESEGDQISFATNDVEAMTPYLMQFLTFIEIPIKVVLPIALMFVIHIKLTFVMLPLIIISLVPSLFLVHKLDKLYTEERKKSSSLIGFISEVLDFIVMIKGYCLENMFCKKHKDKYMEYKKTRLRVQLLQQMIWTFGRCLSASVIPIVLVLSGFFIINGELYIGQVFTMILLARIIGEGLGLIYELPSKLSTAQTSVVRLRCIFEVPIDKINVLSSGQNEDIKENEVLFEMRDLSFDYNDKPVLRNVSFSIASGEKVAIIGGNGSGKSTLFKLLQGFYPSYSGTLLFRGREILTVHTDDLRHYISPVTQEHFLFPGTIKDNLLLGNMHLDDHHMYEACKKARIHDFIMSLDDNYETPLVSVHRVISKGQMQRLNIARAFLRDAPILMLDEPTSALDPESAQSIIDLILSQSHEKTVLMILHDVSVAGRFDRIIRLEEGSII